MVLNDQLNITHFKFKTTFGAKYWDLEALKYDLEKKQENTAQIPSCEALVSKKDSSDCLLIFIFLKHFPFRFVDSVFTFRTDIDIFVPLLIVETVSAPFCSMDNSSLLPINENYSW